MSKQLTREQRLAFAQEEALAVLAGARVPMSAATIAVRCEGLSQADVTGALHRLEKAEVVKSAVVMGVFVYALNLVEPVEPVEAKPAPAVSESAALPFSTLRYVLQRAQDERQAKQTEHQLRNFSNGPFVTIKTQEPAEAAPVQLGVNQCSTIAVQIGTLIASLDRPPRQVLTDLIASIDLLRNAGKQLELETAA